MSSMKSFCMLATSLSLAACAESTKPGAELPLSISFSTGAIAGASFSRAATAPSFDVTTTQGTNTLVISKAQIVVARMELQQVGATCASEVAAGDDDAEHAEHERSECAGLTLAPTIVNLPVSDAVVSKLAVTIPAGTYSALEAKIRPIRADGERGDRGRGSVAFLAANPGFAGVSLRVEGTFNGRPFVYAGSPKAQLETTFDPPLVADATPINLTVNVNLASWFRDGSQNLIDPATANAGGANALRVADNIRRSFRAFRDDDRDGHDDHDRNRHGDH